ncbi:MAG: hypothetical protein U1C50_01145 [Patescibacteria group bacterium]|nr:hypothetical protein [Patescibacteria group bacterium]
MGTENKFNPVFHVDGKTLHWQDSEFLLALMGKAKGSGGMNELKILSYLWSSAPGCVTVQELGELLGYGYNCLEQSNLRNNTYLAINKTRELISRTNYSLKDLIEIETVYNNGYRLKPVEK